MKTGPRRTHGFGHQTEPELPRRLPRVTALSLPSISWMECCEINYP